MDTLVALPDWAPGDGADSPGSVSAWPVVSNERPVRPFNVSIHGAAGAGRAQRDLNMMEAGGAAAAADENEGNGEDWAMIDEVNEEGQGPNVVARPHLPSTKEVGEHELTHAPYGDLCAHCRRGRGIRGARRLPVEGIQREREEQAMATYSVDCMFMTEDEYTDEDGSAKPSLVGLDRTSGSTTAHQVQSKGTSTGWPAKRVTRHLEDLGHGGVKVCIKSDQENGKLSHRECRAESCWPDLNHEGVP